MTDGPPVVLVTGASRGLGRGIALHLAGLGHSVAVNFASNADAAAVTVGECEKRKADTGQKFVAVRGDVGTSAGRKAIIDGTLSSFGRIDALVNNAGIAPRIRADMTETSEESFEELMRVNLQGPFFLTQAVVRHWREGQKTGRLPGGFKIIFNTSVSAVIPSVNRPEYCISKAGLAMAVQLWAVRLAAEGIQVFELRPGIMESDMTAGVKEKYDAMIADGLIPLGRWGNGDDVGKAVGAVLQGSFPYSSGQVITIDGGLSMKTF